MPGSIGSQAASGTTSGFSPERKSGNIGPMASAALWLFRRRGGNRLRQRGRSGSPELGSFFLGADGLSMLALSILVLLASGTLSFWLVLGYVLRIARRSGTWADAPSRIVVLGSRLDREGRPTRAYRARLERALHLFERAPKATIFLLGGSMADGAPTEAAVGARYLLARGVPESALVREERSRHTLENLRFYRRARAASDAQPDALVTSRFHLARSSLLASGLQIPHVLCGAEDRWSFRPGELLRLLPEAFFAHWYLVGRSYARSTRNQRMLDRIG
ncbi:YdcF family protein [Methylacidimicrobium sp. B4]|uniref:YdcF family protein n=1 Tax=Methylacidimicrobium sp. B4 TaxID=2796139 RepID=UPI001A8DA74C|nr:YdcF family protein [Methylacidimicrobium sp. B4]QSR84666.1 YdcF family protein [Methylacidimicrobium sp. B4]